MNLELNGKVAIVTGASRGIGRAIAETLAAEGARLVLGARGTQDGVRVNAISLEEAAASMAYKLGVARFCEPVEIARAVAFLASLAAGYCNGTIFDVDGGQTRML